MKIVLLTFVSLFGVFILFFLWASYPWKLQAFERSDEIKAGPVPAQSQPTALNILTWNISYAYGLGSEGGDDYRQQTREHFEANLRVMAETITRAESDVVFLQEIDFYAARTLYQDQLEFLRQQTPLKFSARALSWQANYVPHPLNQPADHFGKVYSGGGILSRWPILSNQVYLLEKPASKAWWYNLFYLYRYIQIVTLDVSGKKIKVANLHLEAFDYNNKREQAKFLLELLKTEKIDILAGDFNTLPVGALKRSGFANPLDDYENDQTPKLLEKLTLREVVDPTHYQMNEAQWFTFPSINPDRRLDYIYYSKEWNLLKTQIISPSRPEVSDHLPMSASFKLFNPEFIRD